LNKRLISLMVILFALGWFAHSGASFFVSTTLPTETNQNIGTIWQQLFTPNDSNNLQRGFYDSLTLAPERASPMDRVKESQIYVTKDRVIIDMENVEWAKFTDTNSMDPIIDTGSNALEISPDSIGDLQVGDIISYTTHFTEGTIIHRIVEIGDDGEWYARVKGDNIDFEDPGKVRFDQVERVVIGIIY